VYTGKLQQVQRSNHLTVELITTFKTLHIKYGTTVCKKISKLPRATKSVGIREMLTLLPKPTIFTHFYNMIKAYKAYSCNVLILQINTHTQAHVLK